MSAAQRSTQLVRKVVVTVVGVAVLALGVAMLALPGPGVLVIALGFLILSSEYEWARRNFETAKRKGGDLADQAVSNPFSTALSITGALLIIGAGILWGVSTSLPASGWWTGGSLIFGGVIALVTIFYSIYQGKHGPTRSSGDGQQRHREDEPAGDHQRLTLRRRRSTR